MKQSITEKKAPSPEKILVAESGEETLLLERYAEESQKLQQIVKGKWPSAQVITVTNYIKEKPANKDVLEHLSDLFSSLKEYDLLIAYIPESHTFNSILIRTAYEHQVPSIAVLQYNDENAAVASTASYTVTDMKQLIELSEVTFSKRS